MATNFHRVLCGVDEQGGFLQAITLPKPQDAALRSYRQELRRAIRDYFQQVSDRPSLQKAQLFAEASSSFRTDEFLRHVRLQPRFRMQGSFSYFTVNDPLDENTPPQQVDLDDGTFLPTSFWVQAGRPAFAAKAYFRLIEEAITPLCNERGWTICRDKPSCVRVLLDSKSHIDLPLYAIPDDDFERLEKSLASAFAMDAEMVAFSEAAYRQLDADRIMLARRDGEWQPSDPRKLEEWFNDAIKKYGYGLRRVVRYLKAWRDFEWRDPEDSIASIALMVIAERAFRENRQAIDSNRDDEALIIVVERMVDLLRGPIANPVLRDQRLDHWEPQIRQEYIEAARTLRDHLLAAAAATRADAVISCLQDALGDRVPDMPNVVEVHQASEERRILSQPRMVMPLPAVSRTTSG